MNTYFSDAVQVIGLFPDLLPNEFRLKLQYPSTPPPIKGLELEKGLLALIEFLTQVRAYSKMISYIQFVEKAGEIT